MRIYTAITAEQIEMLESATAVFTSEGWVIPSWLILLRTVVLTKPWSAISIKVLNWPEI